MTTRYNTVAAAMWTTTSASGGGGGPYFGEIPMAREHWAQDPDWTNPGDGNDIVTTRDNGYIAGNMSAFSSGVGAKPIYVASSSILNGKPAFRFAATSHTVGGYLQHSATYSSREHSVFVVGSVDEVFASQSPVLVAAERRIAGIGEYGNIAIANGGVNNGQPYLYNTTSLNAYAAANSWDSDPHLWIGEIVDNACRLYRDGVLVAEDTSGSAIAMYGMKAGGSTGSTWHTLKGDLGYFGDYPGALTQHADYAEWSANVMADLIPS